MAEHSLAWCGDTDDWDWAASWGFCTAWDVEPPVCRVPCRSRGRWPSNRSMDRALRRAERQRRDDLCRCVFAAWTRAPLTELCSVPSVAAASSHRRCNGRDRRLRQAERRAALGACHVAFAAWTAFWVPIREARDLWADACLRRGFRPWQRRLGLHINLGHASGA